MAFKIRNEALYGLGILSYLVSLIPFLQINVLKALLLIPLILYNLPIMEYLQPKAMTLKIGKKEILLTILAALPYVFMISYFMIIPALLIGLTFLFYYLKKTMIGTVLGTTFVSSLAIVWAYFVQASVVPAIFWTLYVFTGALYVEYKIPYRKLKKQIVITSWIISILVLALITIRFFTPLLMITAIEPSFRFFFPGEKLKSMKELADLGRRGIKRDFLFVSLLIVLSLIKFVI